MPDRTVFSVSSLTAGVKETIEASFDDVWVEGELSNFKRHTSGHLYFTLKDASAQLSGVMWRGMARHLYFDPQDGMQVRIHGNLTVYERRGQYQLIARSMQPQGEGALRQAFEELKRKLAAEGLFDEAIKKPLPAYPEVIGIVTSGTGAAVRDLLSIIQGRYPATEVLLCPVTVQGPGAAEQIANAIEAFGALDEDDPLRPDVLIIGRGGGAIEDLWAFNEEQVARALFACTIPTVSAVGHETDFTIADYVADVRAATPSHAAELVVPDAADLVPTLWDMHDRMRGAITQRLADHRTSVRHLTRTWAFRRPIDALRQQQQRLDELIDRLPRTVRRLTERERQRVESLQHQLRALDPSAHLRRGYVRVEQAGRPVRRAAQVASETPLRLTFADGDVRAHPIE